MINLKKECGKNWSCHIDFEFILTFFVSKEFFRDLFHFFFVPVTKVLVRGIDFVLWKIIDTSEQRRGFRRRNQLLKPVEMSVKLIASDVADESVMMMTDGRRRMMMTTRSCYCRMMSKIRNTMSVKRMTNRLACTVMKEQRTVSHLYMRLYYNIRSFHQKTIKMYDFLYTLTTLVTINAILDNMNAFLVRK